MSVFLNEIRGKAVCIDEFGVIYEKNHYICGIELF